MTTTSLSSRSGTLTRALAELAEIQFRLGDWGAAHASMSESLRAARSSALNDEMARALSGLAVIEAAWGRSDACRTHAGQAIALSQCLGRSSAEATAGRALGLLELGLGHTAAAIERLEATAHACEEHPCTRGDAVRCMLELAEALLLHGDSPGARCALARAESRRRPGCWGLLSATARSRAMLAADDDFEQLFRRALACDAAVQQPFERARTELCFGERLLGARRRREARAHLRAALRTFTELDARPWIDRTRRGLAAT